MYQGFALLDHSLLVPYIIVYIFAQFRPYLLSFAHICLVSPIFAQFRSVRRHWKRSVAEDTKQYFVSERKKRFGPGDHSSSREQGHDHVRREHWHPARILIVGI